MNSELTIAVQAAREAGTLILNYYQADYEIRDKGYHNPVTTADLASNVRVKEILTNVYPEYGWLSEETADSKERLSKKRVWVVDPLDGTKEFIEGVPNFVVSIALVDEHRPILGVLYNPVTGELFTATRGEGAWLNGDPIQCSENSNPSEMVILNSRSETRRGLWKPYTGKFARLEAVGSVAYKLGLTSAGKADIFATLRPKNEWDICAGHCLITEAGGELVMLNGKEVTYNNKRTIFKPGLVAGNPAAVKNTLTIFSKRRFLL